MELCCSLRNTLLPRLQPKPPAVADPRFPSETLSSLLPPLKCLADRPAVSPARLLARSPACSPSPSPRPHGPHGPSIYPSPPQLCVCLAFFLPSPTALPSDFPPPPPPRSLPLDLSLNGRRHRWAAVAAAVVVVEHFHNFRVSHSMSLNSHARANLTTYKRPLKLSERARGRYSSGVPGSRRKHTRVRRARNGTAAEHRHVS